MKLNYLAVYDRQRDSGVFRKIKDQLKGLSYYGLETELVKVGQWAGNILVFGRKINIIYHNWTSLKIDDDVSALYIRYQNSDLNFIRFLRRFKKGRPDRKIVVEIATYPYEKEWGKEAAYIKIKDKIFRNFLRLYVDRIVTFSRDNSIWGIKTIQSINCIDFSRIPICEVGSRPGNEIHMIAVATIRFWHGYDRVIEGVHQYYANGGERNIKVHLVGEGEDVPKYKLLVQAYHLEQQVIFHGQKEGPALDELYNICKIGLVGFGYHRAGITLLSSLKSREYAAKGLPMVIAGKIDIFPKEKAPFVLEVPQSENAVNIREILEWYDDLSSHYETEQHMASEIRALAYKKCDCKVVMEQLCKYLSHENDMEKDNELAKK